MSRLDRVVHRRMDADGGAVSLAVMSVARHEVGQFEIAVALAAPSPVDVKTPVLVAVYHESVTFIVFCVAVVNHWPSALQLVV